MSDAQRRPPAPFALPPLTRRSVLQTGVAGLAAVYGLAGCGDDGDSASGGDDGGGGKASGTASFGSNYSDPVPKKALQAVFDEFTTASGVKVDVNTVDHNTFQEQINNYLQGTPDDVFSWFAGYRMQFFAQPGPRRRHRRRVGEDRRQLLATPSSRHRPARRQAVLRAVLQLPVGGLLPQERVRGEGLRAVRQRWTTSRRC